MVGKVKVGGIDVNKPRMRHVAEAVLALSWRPRRVTTSALADQLAQANHENQNGYSPRHAAYDLRKRPGKQMAERIGKTRHYQATPAALKGTAALVRSHLDWRHGFPPPDGPASNCLFVSVNYGS